MPETFKGTIFLLALVTNASLMPVEELPLASWQTALGLGFLSSVFDNIPLTALALKQGGYDWGFLAYAVGFGGSMIWFGSSAGVALSNMYPEAKSVGRWLRHGWHVAVAYVVGFFVMLAILGWIPDAPHKKRVEAARQSSSDNDGGPIHEHAAMDDARRLRGDDRGDRRQQARCHRGRAARRRGHDLDGHHDRGRGRPARRLERDGDPGRHLDHRRLLRQDRRAELAVGAIAEAIRRADRACWSSCCRC